MVNLSTEMWKPWFWGALCHQMCLEVLRIGDFRCSERIYQVNREAGWLCIGDMAKRTWGTRGGCKGTLVSPVLKGSKWIVQTYLRQGNARVLQIFSRIEMQEFCRDFQGLKWKFGKNEGSGLQNKTNGQWDVVTLHLGYETAVFV